MHWQPATGGRSDRRRLPAAFVPGVAGSVSVLFPVRGVPGCLPEPREGDHGGPPDDAPPRTSREEAGPRGPQQES